MKRSRPSRTLPWPYPPVVWAGGATLYNEARPDPGPASRRWLTTRRAAGLLLLLLAACGGAGAFVWAALLAPDPAYPGAVKFSDCPGTAASPKTDFSYRDGLATLIVFQDTCYTTGDKAPQVVQWYILNGWQRLPFRGSLVRDSEFSLGPLALRLLRFVSVNAPPQATSLRMEHNLAIQWTYGATPEAGAPRR